MQFFETICEIHRGKFLFERSLKKYMKRVYNVALSHTELICLQYLIHNPESSLYDLSKMSTLNLPQVSQVIKKLEKKELITRRVVSETPLKFALNLSPIAQDMMVAYRIHMAEKIFREFQEEDAIAEINEAIDNYYSIIERIAGGDDDAII
ncbi:hypothetical protein PM10SUCC1_19550 [Propionigenium maris DSM 9537]|uniref:HTH marR-type domain-containing protein n=1 Tax=Propionigenium maris DSM 9537 TaxID=1123000 RepID=A0A9W6GMB8_9FUSO|nr:MarR family transcriptional regulator [Propionigenium maris]GLI56441.1 hypothetical protein PM10SUCC1_19550 [Propionigenium maris DSM 9537]